jgi:hypothetical protein
MSDDTNNAAPPSVTYEGAIARLAQAHPTASGAQLSMVASALRGEGAFTSSAVFESAVLTKVPQYLAQMGASVVSLGAQAPARAPGGQFAPAAAPAAPATPPATPAPSGTTVGNPELPDDFALIPQSVVDAMTPQEAKAHYDRVQKRRGFRHPFADAREAARSNAQVSTGLANALAQALAKHSSGNAR